MCPPAWIDPEEQLHFAGPVFDVSEGNLAHRAQRTQPACQGDFDRGFIAGFLCLFEGVDSFLAGVGLFGAGGVGFNPIGLQLAQFFQARSFQF
jgi:hypothetical protein